VPARSSRRRRSERIDSAQTDQITKQFITAAAIAAPRTISR
jgi:hypothetical protein